MHYVKSGISTTRDIVIARENCHGIVVSTNCGVVGYIYQILWGKKKMYGMTFSVGNRTCTLCELNGRMNQLHESELGPNFNVQNIPGIETAPR